MSPFFLIVTVTKSWNKTICRWKITCIWVDLSSNSRVIFNLFLFSLSKETSMVTLELELKWAQINVTHFWKFLGLGLTWTLNKFLAGSVRENWWWRQKTFIIYFCGWCHYYWIRHAGTYRDMGNFPDNPISTKGSRLCPPISFVPTMFRELPTRRE